MPFYPIKRTISRAQDTYGYNRITLRTHNGKYTAVGGGYDMIGSVIGDFLTAEFQEPLRRITAYYNPDMSINESGLYGAYRNKDGSISIDGACGVESVRRIADAIGLSVTIAAFNGRTSGIFVTEMKG